MGNSSSTPQLKSSGYAPPLIYGHPISAPTGTIGTGCQTVTLKPLSKATQIQCIVNCHNGGPSQFVVGTSTHPAQVVCQYKDQAAVPSAKCKGMPNGTMWLFQ